MVRPYLVLWLLFSTLAGCEMMPNGASERGMRRIVASDGARVYIKREVRGQNYDALGISLDGDPCRSLDPAVDHIFAAMGPLVVYCRVDAGVLTTYSTTALNAPARPMRAIHIENHVLDPLAFQELSRAYASRGLTRVVVDLRPDPDCR
jgi:hypothetical protein